MNPNVTFVLWRHKREIRSIFDEHDRTLFTNYLRLKSGDSFNYFSSSGSKITNGREMDILSLASRNFYNLYKDLLQDINTYVQDCKVNKPSMIHGDKKSGLIKALQ